MNRFSKAFVGSVIFAAGLSGPAQAAYDSAGRAQAVTATTVTTIASTAASVIASGIGSSIGGAIGGGVGPVGTPTGGGVTLQGTSAQPVWSIAQTGMAAAAAARGFNIWAQGGFTHAQSSFNAGTNNDTRFDGDIWVGVVGIDFKMAPRVTVGVAGGYQTVDINTTFNAGKIKQTGFGVTPYMAFVLNQNYYVDVSAGYWLLNNDVSRSGGTARATYTGSRWNMGANLNGNWRRNRWDFGGQVGYLYVNAKDDGYTETGSAAVAGVQTSDAVKIGQGRLGASAGYRMGSITPYGMARIEHNFTQPKTILNNGVGAQPAENRTGYRIGGGMRFNVNSTTSGDVSANTLYGKSAYKEYGVAGTVRVAF
ncbi:MAG: autotransporter outer membrane beta-barrel domain-containing protein [Proteobacteria bacterium]|nr:autotransporter outer membrane beta-barrel domain-containing protein [Pseudomonadota bacterium]